MIFRENTSYSYGEPLKKFSYGEVYAFNIIISSMVLQYIVLGLLNSIISFATFVTAYCITIILCKAQTHTQLYPHRRHSHQSYIIFQTYVTWFIIGSTIVIFKYVFEEMYLHT